MGTVVARLRSATAGYAGHVVLDDLDLDVEHGRTLAVLGPSGAGKSTLLALLTGELAPISGQVERSYGRLGVVGQRPDLFGWLTIAENITFGHRLAANRGPGSQPVSLDSLLDLVGLGEVADRYPDEVSGGQAQRAALARALAIAPDLLVLDEPFSALDPSIRHGLQQWLRATATEQRLTIVLVTHDIDEALVVADDIVLLDRRGVLARSWVNDRPATDAVQASVHPLRSAIRQSFDAEPEADDAEFSGRLASVGGRRG